MQILVMDDQEMILELVGDVLGEEGHTIEFARDGEEAIQYYRVAREAGRPFDLVIMDLTIPGKMGGKEAMEKLRQIDPSVKGIVSSGYSNDPVTTNYQKYGFRAIIPKPFDIDELVKIVNQVADL